MRAIRQDAFGGPEVLKVGSVEATPDSRRDLIHAASATGSL
jgi:hypothetical protein